MKRAQINILCTIVFMLGVLIGILMHMHIQWHDIIGLIISGAVFYLSRVTNFSYITKLLRSYKKN